MWGESRVEAFVARPVADGPSASTPVLERSPSHMSRRLSRSTSATCRSEPPVRVSGGRSLPIAVALAAALSLWGSGSAHAQQDTTDTATAALQGRVVSAMTGGPLSDATVRIEAARRGAITDSAGRFRIEGLPPGQALVSVRHPGFEEKTVPIELQAGTVTDATLLLSETVLRVEEIDVTVERPARYDKLEGFEKRRRIGLGHFIGPEEIDSKDPERPSDLLREVPGVRVSPASYGTSTVEIVRRSPACRPALYFDGVEVPGAKIDDLNPLDILALEVYRGSSEIPVAYSRTAGRCGVILVWTRTGERRE